MDRSPPSCAEDPAAAAGAAHARHRPVRWQWSSFDALAPRDLYAALALRAVVFVVEQQCAFLDLDGLDADAWHLLGWDAASASHPGALVAYLRVLPPGCKYPEPAIARVIVDPTHRGRGLGRQLMTEGIRRSRQRFPGWAIRIGAQQRLQRFYEGLGFRQISAPYPEDGIPHVEMLRPDGDAADDAG